MKLKLFTVEPSNRYSGGCLIVAAKNKEEADQIVALNSTESHTLYRSAEVIEGASISGKPRIVVDKVYIE